MNQRTLIALLSLAVSLMIGAAICFGLRFDGQIQSLKNIRPEKVPEAQDSEISAPLDLRIDYLEKSQQFALEHSQQATEKMYFTFTTVAAFASILALYFGVRQIVTDSNQSKVKGEHDKEMRSLAASFQHNIVTISSLISTLEKSYSYRKEVEDQLGKINERASLLEHDLESREKNFKGEVDSINAESVELFKTGFDSSRYIKERANDLRELDARVRLVEDQARNRNLFNPFVRFVRGLVQFTDNFHQAAAAALVRAAEEAAQEVGQPNESNYARKHLNDLREQLQNLVGKCNYFAAVSALETGQFGQSQNYLQRVLKATPLDVGARILEITAQFNDPNFDPRMLEGEFESVYDSLDSNIKSQNPKMYVKWMKLLKLQEGIVYSKKVTLPPGREPLREIENPERSLAAFLAAYDFEKSTRTAFGLAGALDNVSVARRKDKNAQKIYLEASERLSIRIAQGGDDAYFSYLYYMQALIKDKLGVSGANEALSRARAALNELPGDVWCMSPSCGLFLERGKLLDEMMIVERTFKY